MEVWCKVLILTGLDALVGAGDSWKGILTLGMDADQLDAGNLGRLRLEIFHEISHALAESC